MRPLVGLWCLLLRSVEGEFDDGIAEHCDELRRKTKGYCQAPSELASFGEIPENCCSDPMGKCCLGIGSLYSKVGLYINFHKCVPHTYIHFSCFPLPFATFLTLCSSCGSVWQIKIFPLVKVILLII